MAPHLALWPGLCLTVVVYSLNMFGDAVRDLLVPACAAGSAATAPGVSERGSENDMPVGCCQDPGQPRWA